MAVTPGRAGERLRVAREGGARGTSRLTQRRSQLLPGLQQPRRIVSGIWIQAQLGGLQLRGPVDRIGNQRQDAHVSAAHQQAKSPGGQVVTRQHGGGVAQQRGRAARRIDVGMQLLQADMDQVQRRARVDARLRWIETTGHQRPDRRMLARQQQAQGAAHRQGLTGQGTRHGGVDAGDHGLGEVRGMVVNHGFLFLSKGPVVRPRCGSRCR